MLFLGCTTLYIFSGNGRMLQNGKLNRENDDKRSSLQANPYFSSSTLTYIQGPIYGVYPRVHIINIFGQFSSGSQHETAELLPTVQSAARQNSPISLGYTSGSVCSIPLYLNFCWLRFPCPTCHPDVMLKLAITHLRSCCVGIL